NQSQSFSYCSGGPVIYRIRRDGTDYQTLFCGVPAGSNYSNPSQLVRAADGYLYGTFVGGPDACGAVFRIDPNSPAGFPPIVTSLCASGSSDAPANPAAGATLVQGPDGSFYGTSKAGGANGLGAIYRLIIDGSGAGTIATLHSFAGGDGVAPSWPLIVGTDGALYGTATQG